MAATLKQVFGKKTGRYLLYADILLVTGFGLVLAICL